MTTFILYLALWYFGRKLAPQLWQLNHFLFGWQYLFVIDCGAWHTIRMKKLPDGSWHGRLMSRSVVADQDGVTGGYNITKAQALTSGIYFDQPKPVSENVVKFEKYRMIK